MPKPPTTDQELTARVDALEMRMAQAETEIVALDSRVTVLEGETPDPGPDPGPEPEPGERIPLTLVITLNGVTTTLQEATGTELDSYKDPEGAFEMRCIRVTDPALPDVVVHIRPDVAGGREEVVFELG